METVLAGFRGLTDQEKAGYLPVLEWFESFRSEGAVFPLREGGGTRAMGPSAVSL